MALGSATFFASRANNLAAFFSGSVFTGWAVVAVLSGWVDVGATETWVLSTDLLDGLYTIVSLLLEGGGVVVV